MNPFKGHGWNAVPILYNLGGSKGSSVATPVGTQTTVQKSEPWEGQKGHLEQIYGQAQALGGRAQSYYPKSTVTPFSGQSEDALAAMENRARSGSDLQRIGRSGMEATARGDYLRPESNEFLAGTYKAMTRPMVEQFRDATMPSIDAGFSRAGRYGSGLYADQAQKAQDALGRNLGEAATSLYGQNYQQERGRQLTAQQMAPEYAAADYQDAARLGQVGAAREGKAGEMLQDDINRFNFNEQEPWARLANYNSMVQGNYGRTDTTSQPIYGAPKSGSIFGDVVSGVGGAGLLASAFAPFFSSEKLKDKGREPRDVADTIAAMNVPTWNYKGHSKRHIGPMAEEMRDKLGVGDGTMIEPVDAVGVLFAANKDLAKRVKTLEARKVGGARSHTWGV